MSEYDFIRNFTKAFEKSPRQRNEIFECDAELIEIGDQLWALTIDEFNPEEDLFTADDPAVLGANLATATLSDLFAAGATPAWFMQALSLPKVLNHSFVKTLSDGISSVLKEAGCSLCGGDTGCAETWRFCGFAMGPVANNKPLTRLLPCEPQSLWITGNLGDANLAALTHSPTPRFELRYSEAAVIQDTATACIDTSGGFFDAIWILHTLNPILRFDMDLERLPFAHGVKEAASLANFPAEAALLGGAGEYELLFALPAGKESAGLEIGATCVGRVQPSQISGVYLSRDSEPISTMTTPPPCPRDASTVQEHIKDVMLMAHHLFVK